jgi:hypothetical protein
MQKGAPDQIEFGNNFTREGWAVNAAMLEQFLLTLNRILVFKSGAF